MYDDELDLIVSMYGESINVERLLPSLSSYHDNLPDRYYRLHNLKSYIRTQLMCFKPHAVVCESPFFNASTPDAFSGLTDALSIIRMETFRYDRNCYFSLLSPRFIKAAINVKKINDKEAVRQSVLNIDEITNAVKQDINQLDEHSVDAIAIGYSFLRRPQEDYHDSKFY